jgi:hypothetical protein
MFSFSSPLNAIKLIQYTISPGIFKRKMNL